MRPLISENIFESKMGEYLTPEQQKEVNRLLEVYGEGFRDRFFSLLCLAKDGHVSFVINMLAEGAHQPPEKRNAFLTDRLDSVLRLRSQTPGKGN